MKKSILISCLMLMLGVLAPTYGQRKINTTKKLLKAMKKRYQGKWFREFTFVQQTIRYNKQGQPRDTALWYEAVRYPDNFRIDYGHPSKGNSVLFDADTAYRFRKGKLSASRYDPQYFLLVKGGLYKRKLKECLNILKQGGYKTEIFREDTFNGRPAYVIGAEKGDLKTAQFWVDKEHFYVVRRTRKISRGRLLDLQYKNHIASGGGWVEKIVRIEVDGRLVQMEEYTKIDTSPKIPKNFFNPSQYGKSHWHK